MKSVGIDVGSASVKIVVIDFSSTTYSIEVFKEHKLNLDPTYDNQVNIIEFIREYVSQFDPTQTRFVFGVPQEHISVRRRFFPFRERVKILKSLPFELEDDIPFNQSDAIFDAKITAYKPPGAEVLALACPKDHIENALEFAKDGSFDPAVISVEGFAIANVMEDWDSSPPEIPPEPEINEEDDESSLPPPTSTGRLFLHIGHRRSLAVAFGGGRQLAVHSMNWGGENLAKAISGRFEVHYLEGIKALQSKGFLLTTKEGATEDQVVFSETIAKEFEALVREVKLFLLEVKTEHNVNIERVDLTGGISQIRNICPFLTQKFELPTNLFASLERFPSVYFEKNREAHLLSPVAVGLAIEGMKRPRTPPINLRKQEFAQESQSFQKLWEKWRFTIQVASAILVLFFGFAFIREQMADTMSDKARSALKRHARTQANLRGRDATERKIRQYIRDNKKQMANREKLVELQKMNSALDIIKNFSARAPRGSQIKLDVRKLNVEGNTLTLEGYVKSRQNLNQVQQSLTTMAVDKKAKTIKPSLESKRGQYAFAYRLQVDRGVARNRGEK